MILGEDGEPWFVAADLLSTLSLDRKALERLDDDEKGVNSIHTPGGMQEITVVNESGLFNLVLGSRKPEAKAFKRWVTHEILPAIRKTGTYQFPRPPISPEAAPMAALGGIVMSLLTKLWQSDLIACAILAVAWLSAFINSPTIRRNPEALWTWPLIPAARDAAILAGLAALVLAPIPFAGRYYPVEAVIPAVLAYYYAHEWLEASDPEERGIVALVGTMGVLCILAIIWPTLFLPVLILASLTGAGCWLAGRRVRR